MKPLDWTQFTRRIPINATKERIFEAWVSQDQLESWFLQQATFSNTNGVLKGATSTLSKEDTYEWKWHGSEHLAVGVIIENNRIDFLSFTFLGCDVDVKIKEEEGQTLVELTQYNIPTNQDAIMSTFVGCTRGWTFYLTNLKSILEGGIDLRNKNSELANVINT